MHRETLWAHGSLGSRTVAGGSVLLNRERAQEVMARRELDALVATTPENIYYLSDYGTAHSFQFGRELQGVACAVLPADPDVPATLMVPEWELAHLVGCPSWMPELRVQTGFGVNVDDAAGEDEADRALIDLIRQGRETGQPNRMRLLGETLRDLGLDRARLGFDDVRVMQTLADLGLDAMRSRDAVNDFLEIRMIKTPDEVAALRRSAALLQDGIRMVMERIGAGVTPGEIVGEMRAHMARNEGFVSHMTGGGVSYPWIAQPNMDYRYKEGDVIQVDPSGHHRHYWADIGRVACVGEPSGKLQERIDVLSSCHDEVATMLTPGMPTAAIKQRMREIVTPVLPRGFVPMLHLIGLNQNDNPQTLGGFEDDDFVLESSMVVNVEAPYFEVGWAVLQVEETYLVSDRGPEPLSTLPREAYACS